METEQYALRDHVIDRELDLALSRLNSGRLDPAEQKRLEAEVVKELEWRGYYDLLGVRYTAREGKLVRSPAP